MIYQLFILVSLYLLPAFASFEAPADRQPFVCEKINVLYTWVDGNDPVHEMSRVQRLGLDVESKWAGASRYRDMNGLLYSLRSIEKFAPWVDKIFIYTANQFPAFLNVFHPKINMIYHEDVFPNKTDLPSFNSNAIEASMPWLPDEVGPCFIYLNDDVMFSAPVTPSTFITDKGQRLFEDAWVAPAPQQKQEQIIWHKSVASSNTLLNKVYGEANRKYTEHGPHLFNLAVLREMRTDFGKDFESTMHNPLRQGSDTALPFLYHHFTYRNYQTTPGDRLTAYLGISDDETKVCNNLKWILKNNPKKKALCFNDQMGDEPNPKVIECYENFMMKLLPAKSLFEHNQ